MNHNYLWRRLLVIAAACPATFVLAGSSPNERESGGRPGSSEDSSPSATRLLHVENASTNIVKASISGPRFHAPASFHSDEQFDSPRMNRLRKEYHLEDVVRGETSEFKKMLKLRHWVNSRWPIDNHQKFGGDTFAILEKAKTGAGFYCTHSMRVQHAVMTTMGFVARDLGVDCDHELVGRSYHHGVNDIWSNEYAKWVLLDAKYDVHYERQGVPLSGLEVHEAVRNGDDQVVKAKGPDRTITPMKGFGYPETSVQNYWWVAYNIQQNPFTLSYRDQESRLVIFDNPAFRETTWYRGVDPLREHWAYRANAFVPTTDRHQIDWTPGVPEPQVRQVSPGKLEVTFHSVTPNLKEYRVRTDGKSWNPVDGDRLVWNAKPGENVLDVRTRNRYEVDGPVVMIKVSRSK